MRLSKRIVKILETPVFGKPKEPTEEEIEHEKWKRQCEVDAGRGVLFFILLRVKDALF